MQEILMNSLSAKERYKLLSGSIVPRPIAFVTTNSTEADVVNAAPFSFFSMLSGDPPLVSIAVGRRAGVMKDTARNALESKELVIHIVSEEIVEAMNQTAATLESDKSELDLTSLQLIRSSRVTVPAIKEAKIRFECTIESHLPTKNDAGTEVSFDLLIARVLCVHIDDSVYDKEHNYVLADQLKPVARLSGPNYATLGKTYSMKRPD
ncbi:nitrilotriacetate monooxygenase component B [Bacillus sp. JCM 19045]|nr:nitrilotriacetate monooxygenase component B [Bacillus sp. JCM 19045]